MEIEALTKFSNALAVKNHFKQADQTEIVRLIFSYGNSCFSIKILTDVCFACKRKETQRCCSLSFKLSRIRYLPPLKSPKDVIASVNSLCEVQIIDVAVPSENTHFKHFVSGGTKGPAKVSRVHCRQLSSWPSRPRKGARSRYFR